MREVWNNEASDFTPWLGGEENIKVLGDAIGGGIELEVEKQEKGVGPFSADILCKDTVNNHWVLIENQLEKTDHTHLGQLMTYAAGLDAVTIIWIAEKFTDEHRAAIDWINDITEEGINFFGLEIELWKIDNSPVAPKFNIVCKPNDWSKSVKTTARKTELSNTKKLQLEYWTELGKYLEDNNSFIKCRTPRPEYWMNIAIGRTHFKIVTIVSMQKKEFRVYLCISGEDKTAYYHLLKENHKERVEEKTDMELDWQELPSAKQSHVETYLKADPTDKSKWPKQHLWLKNTIEEFHRIFSPIIKELDASEYQEAATAEMGAD